MGYDPKRRGTTWAGCDTCGRKWTAHGEGHCTGCHQQFSSVSAFDAHLRVGCEKFASVAAPRVAVGKTRELVRAETDRGVVWRWPGQRDYGEI